MTIASAVQVGVVEVRCRNRYCDEHSLRETPEHRRKLLFRVTGAKPTTEAVELAISIACSRCGKVNLVPLAVV